MRKNWVGTGRGWKETEEHTRVREILVVIVALHDRRFTVGDQPFVNGQIRGIDTKGSRGEWLHDVDGVLPSLWRAICWAKISTVACPSVRLVHSATIKCRSNVCSPRSQNRFAATAIGCDISLFLLQISRRCVSSRGVGNASCTPLHAVLSGRGIACFKSRRASAVAFGRGVRLSWRSPTPPHGLPRLKLSIGPSNVVGCQPAAIAHHTSPYFLPHDRSSLALKIDFSEELYPFDKSTYLTAAV